MSAFNRTLRGLMRNMPPDASPQTHDVWLGSALAPKIRDGEVDANGYRLRRLPARYPPDAAAMLPKP